MAILFIAATLMIPVQILDSKDIDQQCWNHCVASCCHGLVYAYTDYLDAMCDEWKALITENYEAVMPVPLQKKMGIRYTYQVPFVQQLGVIGNIDQANILINALKDFISYGDYTFNFSNVISIDAGTFIKTNCNLILPLQVGYSAIQKNYRTDLINNLKKSGKQQTNYREAQIPEAIELFQKQYSNRSANYSISAFEKFQLFCLSPGNHVQVICRKATDANNRLQAIALFLQDNKRIYNMMNATTDIGRAVAANHFLLDAVIQEFAGRDLVFDFEGSDIQGIQHFYKNFGAVSQNYQTMHINKLPLPLRWLKH